MAGEPAPIQAVQLADSPFAIAGAQATVLPDSNGGLRFVLVAAVGRHHAGLAPFRPMVIEIATLATMSVTDLIEAAEQQESSPPMAPVGARPV